MNKAIVCGGLPFMCRNDVDERLYFVVSEMSRVGPTYSSTHNTSGPSAIRNVVLILSC